MNKEKSLYILFGGLSFFISFTSYTLCIKFCNINALVSNVISWLLSVSFAYYTNRKWVFVSKEKSLRRIFFEVMKFFSGRILTLAIEEALLYTMISLNFIGYINAKLFTTFLVIIINYFISKFWVFDTKSN